MTIAKINIIDSIFILFYRNIFYKTEFKIKLKDNIYESSNADADAKEIKADLIVIGSHSKKWLDKLLIGSTTEKVLRHTEIPMLIIPTKG